MRRKSVDFRGNSLYGVNMLNEKHVAKRLKMAVDAAGGVRAFARLHGMSPSYVSMVRNGTKEFGPLIESAIGVCRIPAWENLDAR